MFILTTLSLYPKTRWAASGKIRHLIVARQSNPREPCLCQIKRQSRVGWVIHFAKLNLSQGIYSPPIANLETVSRFYTSVVQSAEMAEHSHDITKLLQEWQQGDAKALDRVTEYVYSDLRRRAAAYLRNERRGHSLQTTGLVHEAFIKLVDKQEIEWQDRNHFFAVAAQAMRRILVDYARTRNRGKRGGDNDDLPLDEAIDTPATRTSIDLVALDQALARLATFDLRQAQIVELKYFGGMTIEETAEVLGLSLIHI